MNTAPRLIPTIHEPAYPDSSRRGTSRPWSPREKQIVRERWPRGGPSACAPLLPARSRGAIGMMAAKLGLPAFQPHAPKTDSNDVLDARIRRFYAQPRRPLGALRDFAATVGRTRQWIRARGIELGCAVGGRRGPGWTDAENAICIEHEGKGARSIQKALQRAGFARSEPAIKEHCRVIGISHSLPDPDLYTAKDVGRLLGVEIKTALRWIRLGRLAAKAETSAHDPEHIVTWSIRRKDLREFMIRHPGDWEPGRCDRFWLVELLAGRVGAPNT